MNYENFSQISILHVRHKASHDAEIHVNHRISRIYILH